ncbi:NAD-dependent epimerase/dehydratase family protein [Gilvimarinus agarilyticus]|uniref:vitamin K epoxide reductase family protein n=1 Tax=Gilvimarinus sp. 2_MG-2023 TaxID=3062666 RepID=UPI001C08FA0F|nr:vitamin K epoxide reductase family protein [Gilvimarinus sp. 2_MG-2023]MBU2886536.1 NAD-dependent epimerase/dehydratase family protein [Gilvimarinus agarilyticus]MDO6571204.1 vitamin K epoxide reductase family protein [Gilvimarinus sp. 2_MG-2023]
MADATQKPIVIITGCAGNLGSSLVTKLQQQYTVVGLDRNEAPLADASYPLDLTSADSVKLALERFAHDHGRTVAAVIHLAAYFDFTGEKSPLYDAVNVQGTKNLLQALEGFEVERFVYSGTMLVHKPGVPGQKITEQTPIDPSWAYPESKAETESVITEYASMPYSLLHLAGLYDEQMAVPTLSHQIARIYEDSLKSHVYAGNVGAGQAFIHRDDLMALFSRVVEKRNDLPREHVLLAGEEQAISYEALQNRIGALLHGEESWETRTVPEGLAKAGAWLEARAEPAVPDDFDKGEKPFIRAFMIDMASDHYELDCSNAKQELDWTAQKNVYDELKALINSLHDDPLKWYKTNGITPPDWMTSAAQKKQNPDNLLNKYHDYIACAHYRNLWAPFLTIALGLWLIASPEAMGYGDAPLAISDRICGVLLALFGTMAISWRLRAVRWASVLVGLWLMFAPLVFWTPSAGAYLNGTVMGMLAIGFAALVPPIVGVSPAAEMSGPTTPPGWRVNPSSWFQRAPIIVLALVGFLISRYLTAYQLGHIDGVWEPFFSGPNSADKNGTEEIITSSVSEAWPVPDAGLGALTYMLEILTGLLGSTRRWRTMPWLVVLFGFMIVPLGIVSITFIIIQPIVIGTWCTLCLIGALAMLVQIPYSLDELIATGQFLKRCKKAGKPVLKIFFVGDTDEGKTTQEPDDFTRSPLTIIKDMVGGGVTVPLSLFAAILVGLWLMFTRLTLGHDGELANWEHLIGALVLTVSVCAFAEVARPLRYGLIVLALMLLPAPFFAGASLVAYISSGVCALTLIALALVPLSVKGEYGDWSNLLQREKFFGG